MPISFEILVLINLWRSFWFKEEILQTSHRLTFDRSLPDGYRMVSLHLARARTKGLYFWLASTASQLTAIVWWMIWWWSCSGKITNNCCVVFESPRILGKCSHVTRHLRHRTSLPPLLDGRAPQIYQAHFAQRTKGKGILGGGQREISWRKLPLISWLWHQEPFLVDRTGRLQSEAWWCDREAETMNSPQFFFSRQTLKLGCFSW